jgi:RNA polymerase sigma factor (sigma-70 family)
MQAFAAGDARAFETLYDRNLPAVWRYVLRSVHDAALADELVQDVWFSIVRQAPHYQPRARFRTWLFTLAHHRMVDHFRTHHPHASLDAATEDGASLADTLAADSGFGPLRQLQSREQAQAPAGCAGGPARRAARCLPATGRGRPDRRRHRRHHWCARRNRQEPAALRPRHAAPDPGGLAVNRPDTPLPRHEATDELVRRYHEASAQDPARPSPALRETVLAQARAAAARSASSTGDAESSPDKTPEWIANNNPLTPGSDQKSSKSPEAGNEQRPPTPPTTAPWRLRAVASVAVLGLATLLFLQFERGTPDERELTSGGPALAPPALPSRPGKAESADTASAPAPLPEPAPTSVLRNTPTPMGPGAAEPQRAPAVQAPARCPLLARKKRCPGNPDRRKRQRGGWGFQRRRLACRPRPPPQPRARARRTAP